MLLHLVKKDILIAKKYVLLTMLIIIVIPIFVAYIAPTLPGLAPLLYMVVLGEMLLLQVIAQEEAKHPKTVALLCATPYRRNTFVYAKYALFFFILIYCIVVHFLVTLFINKVIIFDLTSILVAMLTGAVIFGTYTPIEFKYGVVRARFVFTVVILLFSMGPSLFMSLFGNISLDFSVLKTLSPVAKNMVLALGNILTINISLSASLKIFAEKEL